MEQKEITPRRTLEVMIRTASRQAREKTPWPGWNPGTVRGMPDRYRHLGSRYLPLRHLFLTNLLWKKYGNGS